MDSRTGRTRPDEAEEWWTRSQRILTLGEIPVEVALLEVGGRPVYQRIAGEALQMRRLGMSIARIARHLQVDAKTVLKAVETISC